MDLSDSGTTVNLVAGLVILVGVLGVVIPVLPGLLLCWAGVLLWALLGDAGSGRWVVLGLATAGRPGRHGGEVSVARQAPEEHRRADHARCWPAGCWA